MFLVNGPNLGSHWLSATPVRITSFDWGGPTNHDHFVTLGVAISDPRVRP
jgi:hypothetical protein